MPNTIIPVLNHSTPMLTNPQDKILYILRNFIYLPSNLSDTFSDLEISLNYLIALCGQDKEELIRRIEAKLTSALSRTLGEGAIVEVKAYMGKEETEDEHSLFLILSSFIDGKNYSSEFAVDLNRKDNKLGLKTDGEFIYNL